MADSPTNAPTPHDSHRKAAHPTASKPARKVRLPQLPKSLPIATHPGLLPGIGVEDTQVKFPTNTVVLVGALITTLAVIIWAFVDPVSVNTIGSTALTWVVNNFAWLFTILAIAIFVFMLIVGFGSTGGIRLGADDEVPEFSTGSWISMLFAAGLGIGLIFYGPLEPLTHFNSPAPSHDVTPGSAEAALPALSQTVLHWGPIAWSFYALVGGAIAYNSYRRGRAPLISALFEPVFPGAQHRVLGRLIDFFAIVVTLFGTAVSLGIGALQIQSGVSFITGFDPVGNFFIVGTIAVLTSLFIASAVSGVKRGLRILSNVNMVLTAALGLFVFIMGPTVFILNLLPGTLLEFVRGMPEMLSVSPADGEEAATFLSYWTTYYWAWWVSWTPFVGMFIAKISRGRTLRQFVATVIIVPAAIVIGWFLVYGSTAIWFTIQGEDLQSGGTSEEVLFQVLSRLPFGFIASCVALLAIIIFFVTCADSASIVMASMSQSGRPTPSKWVIILWGLLLGLIAIALLLAGGSTALGGLQALMVVSALPFAVIIIGIMFAWAKDLRTDPFMIRRKYAKAAIASGVRSGIDEYGDDFTFASAHAPHDVGAGVVSGVDSGDPALSEWYTSASTGPINTTELRQQVIDPQPDIDPKPDESPQKSSE